MPLPGGAGALPVLFYPADEKTGHTAFAACGRKEHAVPWFFSQAHG